MNQNKSVKIRFKGFTEAWEQRKLEELASKFTGGGTPNTSNPNYWNGEIPWIQSSDLEEDDVLSLTVKKHISQEGLKNSAAKIIPKNSLVIVTRVGVGKLVVNTQEIATSQDFLSLSGIKGNSRFLAYSLYSLLKKNYSEGPRDFHQGYNQNRLLKGSDLCSLFGGTGKDFLMYG